MKRLGNSRVASADICQNSRLIFAGASCIMRFQPAPGRDCSRATAAAMGLRRAHARRPPPPKSRRLRQDELKTYRCSVYKSTQKRSCGYTVYSARFQRVVFKSCVPVSLVHLWPCFRSTSRVTVAVDPSNSETVSSLCIADNCLASTRKTVGISMDTLNDLQLSPRLGVRHVRAYDAI